jgi:hypothetical protein
VKYLQVSLICSLILGLSFTTWGQSGRRPQRSETPPPAINKKPIEDPIREAPITAPEPVEEAPAAPSVSMVLTTDNSNGFQTPDIANYVAGAFAARIRQVPAVSLTVAKPLNRKEATDRAKSEEETLIVWLQVSIEGDGFSQTARSLNDFRIDYVVFTPKTGKPKNQGRVYLRPYQPNVGVGSINLPLPQIPVGRSSLELSLQQAGFETADRVLSSLSVSVPSPRRFQQSQ